MTNRVDQRYQASPIESKYYDAEWYKLTKNYMKIRYPPVVNRLSDVFRYVDLDPRNMNTFSYEFASLLRDLGSTFSSICDSFVKGVNNDEKNYSINHYRRFLLSEMEDLELVTIQLNVESDFKYVLPFRGFRGRKHSIFWWNAYNEVKHLDILKLNQGSLVNVLYAFCALSALVIPILHGYPYHLLDYTNNLILRIDSHISDPEWYRRREFREYLEA